MSITRTIESKFVFGNKVIERAMNVVKDNEGNSLAFSKKDDGNNLIFTKDHDGVEVAIEHCLDGTKIFHMAKDSKGLPAMHEFKPDGTEFIYLFDDEKRLEKMIEMKGNGDKITSWFSPKNDQIKQEQRLRDGTVFSVKTATNIEAMIWLKVDGSVTFQGPEPLLNHLKSIFSRFLDGAEF